MDRFAVYLHDQTCATTRPRDEIEFVGHSLPHFDALRHALASRLAQRRALPPREAPLGEFEKVHKPHYLNALRLMSEGMEPEKPPRRSIECAGLEYALPGYQYSLGGLLEAIDEMRRGTLDAAYCFALPGHHAHSDWGHGYCILNPLAAAARYAQAHGFERVLMLDWDHHHGDGTQSIFAGDETVHCISVHSAVDLYMSMVGVHKAGSTAEGDRSGHTNIPVLDTSYSDSFWCELGLEGSYIRGAAAVPAFERALESVSWQPDIIMIFSGYDGHRMDCGNRVQNWDDEHFAELTRIVCRYGGGSTPILSVHGGGYRSGVTVSAALAHIDTLATYPGCDSNA